ncbi:hypothetical protein ACP70R_032077 [Stipagrostis hirtigluma subsp. patula]
MKREGWQHGAVRISRSKLLRVAGDGEEEEAAGGGAVAAVGNGKAPAKPTNASRSTGKCRRPRCAGCHLHPVAKARDKAKGAHKLRACDVALNHRLVSWRVVDGGGAGGARDYKGASASAVLAYLAGSGHSWHEDDDDGDGAHQAAPPAGAGLSDLYDLIVGRHAAAAAGGQEADPARATDLAVEDTDAMEEQEQDGDDGKGEEDEEDDDMGFCMVGITIALEFSDGEEDWIVVEEI